MTNFERIAFGIVLNFGTQMMNANESERTGFAKFRQEFADCWHALPFKGLFLIIVVAWLALFHFLGNSTLGYTNTSSLFAWLDWVIRHNLPLRAKEIAPTPVPSLTTDHRPLATGH